MPTPAERDAEPFRWCVHCDVDCDADEPHREDCPSVTGIWPVTAEPHCATCSCDHGIRCGACGAVLAVGDVFMHREVEAADPSLPGLGGAPVHLAVCVGCAAHDRLP
jgi:hypothetical protein